MENKEQKEQFEVKMSNAEKNDELERELLEEFGLLLVSAVEYGY